MFALLCAGPRRFAVELWLWLLRFVGVRDLLLHVWGVCRGLSRLAVEERRRWSPLSAHLWAAITEWIPL